MDKLATCIVICLIVGTTMLALKDATYDLRGASLMDGGKYYYVNYEESYE